MSSRANRRAAKGVSSAAQNTQFCECNNCNDCRDRIIVASMDQLSKYQDELLQEVRDRFTAMDRQINLLYTRVDEISGTVERALENRVTKTDLANVKSMITKVKTAIHEFHDDSKSKKCSNETKLQASLQQQAKSFQANIESLLIERLEPIETIIESQVNAPPQRLPTIAVCCGSTQTEENLIVKDQVIGNSASSTPSSSNFRSYDSSPEEILRSTVLPSTKKIKRITSTNSTKPKSNRSDEWGWIHISGIPTCVTESAVCDYVRRRFGLRSVICKLLLKKSQHPEDMFVLSFKLGVKRNYVEELLNRHRWPSGTNIRRFSVMDSRVRYTILD